MYDSAILDAELSVKAVQNWGVRRTDLPDVTIQGGGRVLTALPYSLLTRQHAY
jgi:hypothetical protein